MIQHPVTKPKVVMFVRGTWSEIIKLERVIKVLQDNPRIYTYIVCTSQQVGLIPALLSNLRIEIDYDLLVKTLKHPLYTLHYPTDKSAND